MKTAVTVSAPTKESIQEYIQDWLDEVVKPEDWISMKSVNVPKIIEDAFLRECDQELERNIQISSSEIDHTTTYTLNLSRYTNTFLFVYNIYFPFKYISEEKHKYIEYKRQNLHPLIMDYLEVIQRRLFDEYVDQKVKEWISEFEKSDNLLRTTLAKRDIKLFKKIFRGKINKLQVRTLREIFKIHDWKDVYKKYDLYLRAKLPTNSTNIHHSENIALLQAILKYRAYLQSQLNNYESNVDKFEGVSNYSNDFPNPFPKICNQQAIDSQISESLTLINNNIRTRFLWLEQRPSVAEQQLKYLYNNLINPTEIINHIANTRSEDLIKSRLINQPFIDCSYNTFKEVMQGNSGAQIIWTGAQIHLLHLLKLLQNQFLIKPPSPYFKGIIQSFNWDKGNFNEKVLKSTSTELGAKLKKDKGHYLILDIIVQNVKKIKKQNGTLPLEMYQ